MLAFRDIAIPSPPPRCTGALCNAVDQKYLILSQHPSGLDRRHVEHRVSKVFRIGPHIEFALIWVPDPTEVCQDQNLVERERKVCVCRVEANVRIASEAAIF